MNFEIIMSFVALAIFVLIIFYLPTQIEKYFRYKNIKKYNIKVNRFYVEEIDLNKLSRYEKVLSPEYSIRCNFTFEYKGKKYESDNVMEIIYNVNNNTYFNKGYGYLKSFVKSNDKEKFDLCYETIMQTIKRKIYEIDLCELKCEVKKEINN